MKWDAATYDTHHEFVSKYGENLLDLLPQNSRQNILDLGCGTGTLTKQLAQYGTVLGVDGSSQMIQQAKKNHPEIDFQVMDALALPFDNDWNIIFSNAVFHWISDHETLLAQIYQSLTLKGILICEFGAAGNIQIIEESFQQAIQEAGYDYCSKFTFPKTEIFKQQLVAQGFSIEMIDDYDRPTPLSDGKAGLAIWGRQFFEAELAELLEHEQAIIIQRFTELAKACWQQDHWVADYRRLRVVAHK
ncbi:class I SAM-dependent methyltransferase [Enterococcus saccharolyticus]|uniref:class I SAM-dependent methyltransferase n=1 Tax=Enterococcus saccharolyticus TaxID=41997 RepID=UPI001E405BBD|nr:class I SAM-dependent methyltransferase [Enterococcus saccharolyticus]MCD5003484.1 class I SAM-dependent methyltransferase [Enterococcus saccharolyticus]